VDRWLAAAIDYVPRWLEFQMRLAEQPGMAIAITHRGRVILERAYGMADLGRGIGLTPRHRFRVASHSKSFTATGVMKLREQGKLRLDDPVGRYVPKLHPAVARATVAQLLSHTSGIVRDGADTGQWVDRRPFLSAAELRADLAEAPILEANTRFKYSNHAYGLAGFVIEAVTGESFNSWIKREIVDVMGLQETQPDVPLARGTLFARGHTAKLPLGRRLAIPGDNSTHALAAATGFVSTAADLARFFNQLSPSAKASAISPASRREMIRRQWRLPHSAMERYYGLGIISATIGDWDCFGHAGGFQGYITRTSMVAEHDLAVSVLTNAADGRAHPWHDGVFHILRQFRKHGAPATRLQSWTGRWWSLWGTFDLLPVGNQVVVVNPGLPEGFPDAFKDASRIEITGRHQGRIVLASGTASHGEGVRRVRGRSGRTTELWLAGAKLLPEAQVARELEKRYGGKGKT
jgi:CubicO group peptidase (beta-lactamase class C family)